MSGLPALRTVLTVEVTGDHPHVAIIRWPAERALRAALRERGMPRLLVVDAGENPPTDTDVLEDWASSAATAAEVGARIATLEVRAVAPSRPSIGDDDVVRFRGRWVSLGSVEAAVARVLLARLGDVVSRGEVEAAAWGERVVRANTTDRQAHRLRTHLRSIGLELHTLRGKGYVLEAPGFEASGSIR